MKGDCGTVCFVCTFYQVCTLVGFVFYLDGKLELIEIFDIFFFLFTYHDKYEITIFDSHEYCVSIY